MDLMAHLAGGLRGALCEGEGPGGRRVEERRHVHHAVLAVGRGAAMRAGVGRALLVRARVLLRSRRGARRVSRRSRGDGSCLSGD